MGGRTTPVQRGSQVTPSRPSGRIGRRRQSPIEPDDPFDIPSTREATPAASIASSNGASPAPPPVITNARRLPSRDRSSKRRAVPLDMPEAVSETNTIEPALSKRRQSRRAAEKPASQAELTPEELGAGVSRQQQEDLFKLADRKAEAAEAWRTVGAAVLSAANRQFAALKTNPWRTQLFAKSSVKVGPIKMEFAKELFDISIDTMLPRMAERESKAAGAKLAGNAMTVSFTPKARAPPEGPQQDENRPGFSAFREAKLNEEAAPSSSDSTEAGSEVGCHPRTPTRKRHSPTIGDSELQYEWDEKLTDEERNRYKLIEDQRAAECKRQLVAWEEEQAAPKTAYAVRLREPQIARKLLRLPEQWKAFDYVSVAGHQVQKAKVTKVHMNYDVATQQLTLDCTVGYPEEAQKIS